MCKISLKSYEKLSSSSDKLRMRPDFHVKAAPQVFSDHRVVMMNVNANANNHHVAIIGENDYNGRDHYTTTYNKTTRPHVIDDSKYETTLIDFKFVKDAADNTGVNVNELVRAFVDKIMTKYAGQTALRKAFKMMNISGAGVGTTISHDDLTASLHMLGIWVYTDAAFRLFYIKLAGGINKMITYVSFRAFIEDQNDFIQSCEI